MVQFRQDHGFDPPCGSHQLPVYLDNGAQIKSPHDKGISRCIEENRVPWKESWDICTSSDLIKDPFEEICASYFEDIKKYSHFR
ncbi:hypothetical protein ACROYT_G019310 [Oculina patagonica]